MPYYNNYNRFPKEPVRIDSNDLLNADVYDEYIEEGVIGSIMTDPQQLSVLETLLSEDMFYTDFPKEIYKIIKQAYSKGELPGMIYVMNQLKLKYKDEVERSEKIAKLASMDKFSTNLEQDIEILNMCRQKRIAAEMAREIISKRSATVEEVHGIISKAIDRMDERKQTSVHNLREVVNNIKLTAIDNQIKVDSNAKTLTGFKILDSQGGFQPGMEIVLSAGTSQGKTSLAMTIVLNALKQKQKLAIYSMEMGEFSVGMRLMNADGLGLRSGDVRSEKLLPTELNRVCVTADNLLNYGGDIFIDSSSKSSIDKIISSIRTLKRKYGINGVVVDYIQILNVYSKYGSTEQMLADIARRLQEEAKNSQVWIMILSQFNRVPKGMSHEPTNDMVRGSGQIIDACDISLLLYRPEVFGENYAEPYEDVDPKGTAKLEISKFRDGKLGSQILRFEGEYMRFSEFEEWQIPRIVVAPKPEENTSKINTPF